MIKKGQNMRVPRRPSARYPITSTPHHANRPIPDFTKGCPEAMGANGLYSTPSSNAVSDDVSMGAMVQKLQAVSMSADTSESHHRSRTKQKLVEDDLAEALQKNFSVASSNILPRKELRSPKSPRKSHSSASLRQSERAARDAGARKMHDIGLQSLSKARAEEYHEVVFHMVFDNITPCPDDNWLDFMCELTHWYVALALYDYLMYAHCHKTRFVVGIEIVSRDGSKFAGSRNAPRNALILLLSIRHSGSTKPAATIELCSCARPLISLSLNGRTNSSRNLF